MALKRYSEGQIVTRQELESQGYTVSNQIYIGLRQAKTEHNNT